MGRKRLASMFAVVASAGVFLAAGCASAATKIPTAGDTSVTKTATAGGTVHVVGYSKNSDGPDFTVIVTGAIGDYGPAVAVRPNGAIDPELTSELKLGLKKGSFLLSIANLGKKIVSVTSHWRATRTCSFHLSVTAATPVVAGSGTGSYRGVTGGLNMTVTIDEVDVKPCPAGTSRFLSQLIIMVGTGTVSVG
jgi:hypothetical protein